MFVVFRKLNIQVVLSIFLAVNQLCFASLKILVPKFGWSKIDAFCVIDSTVTTKDHIVNPLNPIFLPVLYPYNMILTNVLNHEAYLLIVMQIDPEGNIIATLTEHSPYKFDCLIIIPDQRIFHDIQH